MPRFNPLALEILLQRDFVGTLELEFVLLVGSMEDSVLEVVEEKLERPLSNSLSLTTSFPVIAFRSLICSLKSTWTMTRSGSRSFEAACTDAASERFPVSITRQSFFRSNSVSVG